MVITKVRMFASGRVRKPAGRAGGAARSAPRAAPRVPVCHTRVRTCVQPRGKGFSPRVLSRPESPLPCVGPRPPPPRRRPQGPEGLFSPPGSWAAGVRGARASWGPGLWRWSPRPRGGREGGRRAGGVCAPGLRVRARSTPDSLFPKRGLSTWRMALRKQSWRLRSHPDSLGRFPLPAAARVVTSRPCSFRRRPRGR